MKFENDVIKENYSFSLDFNTLCANIEGYGETYLYSLAKGADSAELAEMFAEILNKRIGLSVTHCANGCLDIIIPKSYADRVFSQQGNADPKQEIIRCILGSLNESTQDSD